MSIIKPIPKRLLIHSIIYREKLPDDGWGGGFAEPVTIENIRVEPARSINRSGNADDIVARNIVFIDRVYSKPFLELKEKSKVEFNGKEYEVNKVSPHYGFKDTPHHYEVELV